MNKIHMRRTGQNLQSSDFVSFVTVYTIYNSSLKLDSTRTDVVNVGTDGVCFFSRYFNPYGMSNLLLHDGSGFEQIDLLTIREAVGEGRDAAVGVDLEEPFFFLGIFGDVDFFDGVGEARYEISWKYIN